MKSPANVQVKSPAIYLDHNATTPLHPQLFPLIPEWLGDWGNPSSTHWASRAPKQILREARLSVSKSLGVSPLECVFTSGGSESNNCVLKGFWSQRAGQRNVIVTSTVEHPSINKTCEYLQGLGARWLRIGVNRQGDLDMTALVAALNEQVVFLSLMGANNETGRLWNLKPLVELAHRFGILVHSDLVQMWGKVAVDLNDWGLDAASFSGHKLYALKGVGVLFQRRGQLVPPLIHGGGQERFRRAGTENTLGIRTLGWVTANADFLAENARVAVLRDHFETEILAKISGIEILGRGRPRLGNTSSVLIDGIDGETLAMNLDVHGFAVSTGSACSSGSAEPSQVLQAMGLSRLEASQTLRVGFGWQNTQEQVDLFIQVLIDVVARQRRIRRDVVHAV